MRDYVDRRTARPARLMSASASRSAPADAFAGLALPVMVSSYFFIDLTCATSWSSAISVPCCQPDSLFFSRSAWSRCSAVNT